MNKKLGIAAALLLLILTFTFYACADEIEGSWKGKIYATKYFFTISKPAKVTFTDQGRYTLNTGAGDSVGTYVLTGDRITLTSSGGRVVKLSWKLKGNTLTMSGVMDVSGYSNVSTRMVVKRQVPKITGVICHKAEFGQPSTITVNANNLTDTVKIVLDDGTVLASSSNPDKPGEYKFTLTFDQVKTKVTVIPGMTKNADVIWYTGKKATLETHAVARLTNVIKIAAEKKKTQVDTPINITVTANSNTTKVKLVGAASVESSEYTTVGGKRVFTVSYSQSQVKKNQAIKVYSGDEYGFKAAAKTIKIGFTN